MLYAIVHKNRVVVGPLAWAQKYFTNVLKIRHRVQANIPGQAPADMPYTVDEHTAIYEVIENKPELDPMVQAYRGPFWEISQTHVTANYEVHDHQIATARNNFRYLAAHERYKKEIAGTKTTVQDTEVSLDTARGNREIFIQKYLLMGDNDTVNWKFPETWLTLTKTDLGQVVQAGAQYIQDCFDWEKTINDQIDAAENAQQLYAIEIEPLPQVPEPEAE